MTRRRSDEAAHRSNVLGIGVGWHGLCRRLRGSQASRYNAALTKQGEVAVTATYARFQPSTITVARGQVIQLKVSATDTNHTFTVDELGINIAVGRGQTVTKEVKVETAGTFKFYCTVPGHRGAGMEGTLRITE